MPVLKFTVDSALLEELGERLVGKPYIALAELVKNSYDADATKALIELNPRKDRIVVSDNGHGMNFEEFKNFWMRIGSTHKVAQRISRNFKRPMTGSKGVGRLAVQYLAKQLRISTTPEENPNMRLEAYIEWEKAIHAGNLTDATAEYEITKAGKEFGKGTRIILTGLKHEWNVKLVRGLAEEIWWLQPPFRGPSVAPEKAFCIEFSSQERAYKEAFDTQIKAILDIWYARLIGKNSDGKVSLSLEYAGERPILQSYPIRNCELQDGDFEIRIYHLTHRQPHGIKVKEARDYFDRFAGVHVYDEGFHLPYYGNPRNDWLRIEFDHSHRLSTSRLLPKALQVEEGMTFLPTLSRIFGIVNVNTSTEPNLKILITRDRLQESEAFQNLVDMVRWALDFYATEERRRVIEQEELVQKIEKPKYRKIQEVLEKYKPEVPLKTYENLRKDLQQTTDEIETDAEKTAKQVGVMGSLATAGISSLAYQHELKQQFRTIDDVVEDIGKLAEKIQDNELREDLTKLKEDLSSWLERARATNALFAYFADAENIRTKERFRAKKVVEEVAEQVKALARGIPIDTRLLDDELLLPKASLVEWSSVFQNVFLNAFNAMIDSEKKLIQVSSRGVGETHEILVQDTGFGVNLKEAQSLFEPFERRVKISPERRALGYGGMGLGLAIARMIGYNIGCEVSFVEPEKGFKTAFSLKWREME